MAATNEGHKVTGGDNIQHQKGIGIFPYCYPVGLSKYSTSFTHKCWKYYQEVLCNTYHGGHIETDHRVIFSVF